MKYTLEQAKTAKANIERALADGDSPQLRQALRDVNSDIEKMTLGPMDYAKGAVREAAQGFTWGAADEMEASTRALSKHPAGLAMAMAPNAFIDPGAIERTGTVGDVHKDYAQAHADITSERRAFDDQAGTPVALGLNFFGGLGSGGSLAKMIDPKNWQGLGGALRSIGAGTGAGATAGFLSADPGERLEGAAYGAAGGGALSGLWETGRLGVKYALAPAIAKAHHMWKNSVGGDSSREYATSRIFDLTESDPAELIATSNSRPGPSPLAAEDEGLLQAARAGVEKGGKSAKEAQLLREASRESARRLSSVISEAGGNVNAQLLRKSLLDTRKAGAKEMYGYALNQPIKMTPALKNIWDQIRLRNPRKWIREMRQEAELDYLNNTGQPLDPAMLGTDAEPTMMGWHYIQKRLRRDAKDQGFNTSEGANRLGLRKTILDEIEKQNSAYLEARSFFRGKSESIELVDLGRELIVMPEPSRIRAKIADIETRHGRKFDMNNEQDRELVAVGIAEGLEDILAAKGSADIDGLVGRKGRDVGRAVFDKEATQNLLKEVFGEERADDVYKWVAQEMNLHHVTNTLSHSTATSRSGAVKDFLAGGPAGGETKRELARKVFKAADGVRDDVLDDIASALLSTDPERKQRLLRDALNYKEGRNAKWKKRISDAARGPRTKFGVPYALGATAGIQGGEL